MQNQPVKQEDSAVIIWPRNYNTRWLQFTAKWRNLIAIWMSSDTATWRSMTAIWQIKDKLASCGCVMCVRAWGLACGLVRARMVVLVRATNTCVCLLVCDSQCVRAYVSCARPRAAWQDVHSGCPLRRRAGQVDPGHSHGMLDMLSPASEAQHHLLRQLLHCLLLACSSLPWVT